MFGIDVKTPATGKSIYFWNSMGSLFNAASSFLFLFFVVRLIGEAAGDVFSLGFSVATLMWSVAFFETMTFQATDTDNKYSFGNYQAAKVRLYLLSVIIGTLYALISGWDTEKVLITFLLCVYKGLDGYAAVYMGLMQKCERLDISGKSTAFRNLGSMLLFVGLLLFAKSLFAAVIAMTVFSLIWVFTFDVYYAKFYTELKYEGSIKKTLGIVLECLPLFAGTFALNYIATAPKSAIESFIADEGVQTAFSVILMPVSVINLCSVFIFRPSITGIAELWRKGDLSGLKKKISLIVLIISGLTVLAVLCGYLVGIPVLSFVFGIDLSDYLKEFCILLLGGGASALITFFYNVTASMRKQAIVFPAFVAAFLIGVFLCPAFVKKYGVFGASLSYTSVMLFLCAAFFVFVAVFIRSKGRKNNAV